MTLILEFKGTPTPKGRPRISMQSGYAIAYTPAKTRTAENNLRAQATLQLPANFTPLTGPLLARIQFRLQRPKSLPKKIIYHTKKSDLDNLLKLLLDALESVVFVNDSQFVGITMSKEYGVPGISMEITQLEI